MKKLIIFFINISLIQLQFGFGQSIKRSTLCSVAITKTSNDLRVSSTMGQECVGCTVLEASNGQGFVRQGFQQPPDNSDLIPECNFGSAIAFEAIENDCGLYFNFEYIGLAIPSTAEFLWDFGDFGIPGTSTDQNPSDVTFSTPINTLVTVTVTVPDVCEESAASFVNALGTGVGAMAMTEGTACFGDETGTIDFEFFNGTPPYNIQWEHTTSTDIAQTGLVAGDYPYTVTDSGDTGCTIEGVATIEGPAAELSVQPVALSPESCSNTQDGMIEVEVLNGQEPYTYTWSNQGTGSSIGNLEKGMYSVQIVDANGCQASASFEILNYCEDADDILYDIFSPNGDGMNDMWIIPGIESFPNNEVVIHNRWGNVVWSINGYNNTAGTAFEGKNNDGKDLPTGAYYYVLQMNDQFNIVLGGAVTLVR